jgi:hypothetical protein
MSDFPATFISDLEAALGVADKTTYHGIRVDHGSGIKKGTLNAFFSHLPPGYVVGDEGERRMRDVINASTIKTRHGSGASQTLTPFSIRTDERGRSEVVVPLDLAPDIRGRALCEGKREARKVETAERLRKKLAARRAAAGK